MIEIVIYTIVITLLPICALIWDHKQEKQHDKDMQVISNNITHALRIITSFYGCTSLVEANKERINQILK